jgi:hypothetical protein
MLERLDQRSPLLALRDATVVSVQYGLGMRNQEVWALTLGDVAARRGNAEPAEPGADDIGDPFGAPLTVARMRAAEVAAAVDLVIGALGLRRARAG